MRETTKKQLLAVLEKQLAKVTEKLEFKNSDAWNEAASEVTTLYEQLRTATTEKKVIELEAKLKKATLRRDKAFRASMVSTDKIEAWVNEQMTLEEEIKTLKYLLSNSTPQLKYQISHVTTHPHAKQDIPHAARANRPARGKGCPGEGVHQ